MQELSGKVFLVESHKRVLRSLGARERREVEITRVGKERTRLCFA